MENSSDIWIGLDLGTSALKAVAIDHGGRLLAQASSPLSVQNPHPLWSEQDPESWWSACKDAMAGLQAQAVNFSSVQAIAVAGQMHGATLIDAKNAVLRPCILWNDGRCFKECEQLEASLPDFRALSGNLAMPGFTAPKLMWVAQHEPNIFAKIHKVLLPKDYLNFCLTGRYASDMSDAAGTLWLDPATRRWNEKLVAATGLTLNQLPNLHEGNQCIGSLTERAAIELNLPVVPVMAGAGDNAAGALGVGITEPGQAFVSLGTSGVFFVVSDRHRASPEHTVHAFCHCLPQRWHQMSVSLSAANSLAWFADMVQIPINDLLAELEASKIDETPVLFLPYLSGERTPHNDPNATGCFFGIQNSTSRPHLTLAVLEGVAYSFADGLAALETAGSDIQDITLIGGGARSERWRQLLADVLNRPLTFRDGSEVGPALGAARLAVLGSLSEANAENHLDSQLLARTCPAPSLLSQHNPNFERQAYHQHQLERYRLLYQSTRSLNDHHHAGETT